MHPQCKAERKRINSSWGDKSIAFLFPPSKKERDNLSMLNQIITFELTKD